LWIFGAQTLLAFRLVIFLAAPIDIICENDVMKHAYSDFFTLRSYQLLAIAGALPRRSAVDLWHQVDGTARHSPHMNDSKRKTFNDTCNAALDAVITLLYGVAALFLIN
jgi:hypothetical protein